MFFDGAILMKTKGDGFKPLRSALCPFVTMRCCIARTMRGRYSPKELCIPLNLEWLVVHPVKERWCILLKSVGAPWRETNMMVRGRLCLSVQLLMALVWEVVLESDVSS